MAMVYEGDKLLAVLAIPKFIEDSICVLSFQKYLCQRFDYFIALNFECLKIQFVEIWFIYLSFLKRIPKRMECVL